MGANEAGNINFPQKESVLDSQTVPLIPLLPLASAKCVKTLAFSFICQNPLPTGGKKLRGQGKWFFYKGKSILYIVAIFS